MSRNIARMHNGRMVALNKAFSGPMKNRISHRQRAEAIASVNEISGWVAALSGRRLEALKYFCQSLKAQPFQISIIKQIIKLFIPSKFR